MFGTAKCGVIGNDAGEGIAGRVERMKLTIHVGLPKTATTYIQHSLSGAKRDLFSGGGVLFPGTSLKHHDLPKDLELAAAGRQKHDRRADALIVDFAREIEAAGAKEVLLSSEYFIESSPQALGLLRQKLETHFPKLSHVTILCYVREPIAFATSFCQQVIKSGHQRLADFYQDPWRLNLRDCLSRFERVFGSEALRVRNFHPDSLKNGDVLEDFLEALGVAGLRLPNANRAINTALSAEAVQIADALAGLRPVGKRLRRHRREYRRRLESIAGDRFVLPVEVQDRIIESSREDIEMLKTKHGIELIPERRAISGNYAMSSATALSLAKIILDAVEG